MKQEHFEEAKRVRDNLHTFQANLARISKAEGKLRLTIDGIGVSYTIPPHIEVLIIADLNKIIKSLEEQFARL